MATEPDLQALLSTAHFQPEEALRHASDILKKEPKSDGAHFVAFKSHAELFAATRHEHHRAEALTHYSAAVDSNPDRGLFPPQFRVSKLIGVGGFSYVFQVSGNGPPTALKVLKQRAPLDEPAYQAFQSGND